jgi:hypothetical protein
MSRHSNTSMFKVTRLDSILELFLVLLVFGLKLRGAFLNSLHLSTSRLGLIVTVFDAQLVQVFIGYHSELLLLFRQIAFI